MCGHKIADLYVYDGKLFFKGAAIQYKFAQSLCYF